MQTISLEDRLLGCKRVLYLTQQGILYTLKVMKAKKIEIDPCSLTRFVDVLREGEFITTFTKISINKDDANWIFEQYVQDLPGPSSISRTIETISMSSTSIVTPIPPADVIPLTSCNEKTKQHSGEDSLDELFRTPTLQLDTGVILSKYFQKEGRQVEYLFLSVRTWYIDFIYITDSMERKT